MFEKALTADLGTINSIIDKVFPQVSTSFTLQEVLMYASAYSEYTLGENIGFPIDQTTDTLSGLGSIVIPQDLTSNVVKLHEFLFGTTGYTPSSTVQRINSNIISTVESARYEPQEEQYNYEEEYEYTEDDYDYNNVDSGYYDETESSGSDMDTGYDGSGSDPGYEAPAPDPAPGTGTDGNGEGGSGGESVTPDGSGSGSDTGGAEGTTTN